MHKKSLSCAFDPLSRSRSDEKGKVLYALVRIENGRSDRESQEAEVDMTEDGTDKSSSGTSIAFARSDFGRSNTADQESFEALISDAIELKDDLDGNWFINIFKKPLFDEEDSLTVIRAADFETMVKYLKVFDVVFVFGHGNEKLGFWMNYKGDLTIDLQKEWIRLLQSEGVNCVGIYGCTVETVNVSITVLFLLTGKETVCVE